MKDFIEVHTWNDHCSPWMVRVKSITKVTRGDHNRAIIYINDSMKMECVETYDSLKEIFIKDKKKKVGTPYNTECDSTEYYNED